MQLPPGCLDKYIIWSFYIFVNERIDFMPAYYDEKSGSWYCKFYYRNYTGEKKQKLKRGFKRKSDAMQYEREFLLNVTSSPDMTFKTLRTAYMEFTKPRLKESTMHQKQYIIEKYIAPYFDKKAINDITPLDVATWQNELLQKGLAQTTQKSIDVQLVAIFNFAVKYKGLAKSPCMDTIGCTHRNPENIDFWTLEEYHAFISHVPDIEYRAIFETLYYSGMRIGELLALTPADLDFDQNTIRINKTFHMLHNKEKITPPKTENSIRTVSMPEAVMDEIREYMNHVYDLRDNYRLFFIPSSTITWYKNKVCRENGLRTIRIHDFRHSHVSLLVEMGCSIMLVAERIGDTVRTAQEIYAHLYPNKQDDIAKRLNLLVSN